jgi:hypothetical protein
MTLIPGRPRIINRKGVYSYLLLTFGIAWGIEGLLILTGMRFEAGIPRPHHAVAVAALMFTPALATAITVRWITGEGFQALNLRFGSWRPYLESALLIPAVFLTAYFLTWVVGLGEPDWNLSWLREVVSERGGDLPAFSRPMLILSLLYLVTIVVTPFINALFGLGEELGWRGYLLPRLMALGKARAYLLTGVIWGLWHAPLIAIGFGYPGYPLRGLLTFVILVTSFSIYVNERVLEARSTILAGWMHGVFNAQAYGVLFCLFPAVNPLYGGKTGIIHACLWAIVALIVLYRRRGFQMLEIPTAPAAGG